MTLEATDITKNPALVMLLSYQAFNVKMFDLAGRQDTAQHTDPEDKISCCDIRPHDAAVEKIPKEYLHNSKTRHAQEENYETKIDHAGYRRVNALNDFH